MISRLPEKTLKTLREGRTARRGRAGSRSAKRPQGSTTAVEPPAVPGGAIEPGKTWAAKPAKMPVPGSAR